MLQFTPCGAYLWLEPRAGTINVSYRMDSAIAAAPERHSAAAEPADSSSDLVGSPQHTRIKAAIVLAATAI